MLVRSVFNKIQKEKKMRKKSQELTPRELELLQSGKVIEAIKAYRNRLNVDLASAVHYLEACKQLSPVRFTDGEKEVMRWIRKNMIGDNIKFWRADYCDSLKSLCEKVEKS